MYTTTNFNELTDEVIRRQEGDRTLFLSFSTGKDSLATFLRCYETGKFDRYVLYYYYLVPGMSWIEEYIDYFEKKFNVKIIQVPNPFLYSMLHNVVYQTPLRIQAIKKLYEEGETFPQFDHTKLMEVVRECEELPKTTYCAVGVKSSDSMMRRTALKKHGLINDSSMKWYPIHDFSNKEIVRIITKHDLYLPEDYSLFGLTFDGLDYRFLKVIKEKKPEDFERIKEILPLVNLKIVQTEKYYGKDIKISKFQKENHEDYKIYKKGCI